MCVMYCCTAALSYAAAAQDARSEGPGAGTSGAGAESAAWAAGAGVGPSGPGSGGAAVRRRPRLASARGADTTESSVSFPPAGGETPGARDIPPREPAGPKLRPSVFTRVPPSVPGLHWHQQLRTR